MITRAFYKLAEAAERLETDQETVRQAVTMGKLSAFLSLQDEAAELIWGEITPDEMADPYCEYRWLKREALTEGGRIVERFTLNGWFRVSLRDARAAARIAMFADSVRVTPVTLSEEDEREIMFRLEGPERDFNEGVWFLASEIDSTPAELDIPTKWPWGDHETPLLQKMSDAAKKFWSNYDPAEPDTATRSSEVEKFLESRGVPEYLAQAMATILRDPNLPAGRRSKK